MSVAFAIANFSAISAANAHGWSEFPPARTVICDADGNYWGGRRQTKHTVSYLLRMVATHLPKK
ncbi:hypothetical protein VT25_14195 [Photobacterium leiognathi subsp. mandapamensis]|nr:hypothetical protein VT25_14195 [Photobacterium leiognathi subsp. mandapamensis]